MPKEFILPTYTYGGSWNTGNLLSRHYLHDLTSDHRNRFKGYRGKSYILLFASSSAWKLMSKRFRAILQGPAYRCNSLNSFHSF